MRKQREETGCEPEVVNLLILDNILSCVHVTSCKMNLSLEWRGLDHSRKNESTPERAYKASLIRL